MTPKGLSPGTLFLLILLFLALIIGMGIYMFSKFYKNNNGEIPSDSSSERTIKDIQNSVKNEKKDIDVNREGEKLSSQGQEPSKTLVIKGDEGEVIAYKNDNIGFSIEGEEFIIATTSNIETPYETIEVKTESKLYDQNEILTIDDYVKFIVNSFQYKFPDTELSKKLGISRKSLWEKRKKYGIFKKK